MSEKLVSIDLGFSAADAEKQEVHFKDGTTLCLKFCDWQEQSVVVEFFEVVTFSWNEEEIEHYKSMDSKVFEVKGSAWLKKHKNFGTIPNDKFRHFKLYFDGWGVLDVIFEEMKVTISDK